MFAINGLLCQKKRRDHARERESGRAGVAPAPERGEATPFY